MYSLVGEHKDFNDNITVSECIIDPLLKYGQCEFQPTPHNDKPVYFVGGYCVVYPFKSYSGKKYAVRCWICELEDIETRTKKISEMLCDYHLPYFVEFTYVEEGIYATGAIRPLVRMEWVEGYKLNEYIYKCKKNPAILYKLTENFLQMVTVLHENRISHGDRSSQSIMHSKVFCYYT